MGLVVNDRPRIDSNDPPGSWFVSYDDGDEFYAIPMVFGRKQDADAAMRAIVSLIEWTGSKEEVTEKVTAFGGKRLKKKMVEALAW